MINPNEKSGHPGPSCPLAASHPPYGLLGPMMDEQSSWKVMFHVQIFLAHSIQVWKLHTQKQQLQQQQHSVLMMKSKRVLTLGGPLLVCVFYPGRAEPRRGTTSARWAVRNIAICAIKLNDANLWVQSWCNGVSVSMKVVHRWK